MKKWDWEDEGYSRRDSNGDPMSLEQYEKKASLRKRGRMHISRGDLRLFAITGVGFFLDSYDLFIINLATPIWTYEYWGPLDGKKAAYPALLHGAVNAASNMGNVVGQLTFGFLGDTFGRKYVYGKELIICIIGTILVISLPNSIPTPTLKMVWIFCFRFLMGIGIGGDYPMSASIVSERSHLHSRGQLLAWVFSNQGWGTLAGSLITLIILVCFSSSMVPVTHFGSLDAIWRIQMGLALIPAFITLWPRLTMPEGRKYLESQELNTPSHGSSLKSKPTPSSRSETPSVKDRHSTQGNLQALAPTTSRDLEALSEPLTRKAKLDTFFVYFSEWRHLKTLLGTTSTWFLLDIAFYGTNLNQSILLTEIGFSTGDNEYSVLLRNACGNLIIAVAGYVPGYFFTIVFVERLGRRWIQIQGFLICGLMFAILAGDYKHLGTAPKFVCFAIAQFFFNFGPNATTFIIPAEIFPSRVRGFSHGLSAAVGKCGAILSALLFNYLSSNIIGLANVLWIFSGCNILGAILTWFLIVETRGRDADVLDFEEWKVNNREAILSEEGEKGKSNVRKEKI